MGSYIPPREVTNDQLAQQIETSDAWIRQRTGIRTRFLVDPAAGVSGTTDMAERAAKNALQAGDIDPATLDMIIVGTVTADPRMPSAACMLQHRLGAHRACAFDISAACAGSLYGLAVANGFIAAGSHKRILVVGSETMSSVLDWSDRATCVLFGDGAAAAVVEPGSEPRQGFHKFDLYSDGSQHACLQLAEGGKVTMNGRAVYRSAVAALVAASERILREAGLRPEDLALVIPHQANARIIEAIAKRLGIEFARFAVNLDRYANTSSASLLLAWDEASRSDRIKQGDWVLLLAIGAGMAWGAALYRV